MNKELLNLLGINQDQYNSYVFEFGCAFLANYAGVENNFTQAILETPEYWTWWKGQMKLIDDSILADVAQHDEYVAPVYAMAVWCDKARPSNIVAKPWRKAIDEGYSIMMGKIMKREGREASNV